MDNQSRKQYTDKTLLNCYYSKKQRQLNEKWRKLWCMLVEKTTMLQKVLLWCWRFIHPSLDSWMLAGCWLDVALGYRATCTFLGLLHSELNGMLWSRSDLRLDLLGRSTKPASHNFSWDEMTSSLCLFRHLILYARPRDLQSSAELLVQTPKHSLDLHTQVDAMLAASITAKTNMSST